MNKHLHKTVIFLHIPKTAGTSVRKIVERFYRKKEIYPIYEKVYGHKDYDEFRAISDENKIKFKIIYGHIHFGLHNWIPAPCVYATMLRDPIEQMISLFSHISKDMKKPYYERIKSENMGIGEFIRCRITPEMDNLQTRMLSGMAPKVGECNEEMLETAKKNLEKYFSVFGLTEYFEESICLIKNILGWKLPFHLRFGKFFVKGYPLYEKTNISPDRPTKETLSQGDMAEVINFTKLDRELYAFAKELFLQKIHQQPESFKKEVQKLTSQHTEAPRTYPKGLPQQGLLYDRLQKARVRGFLYLLALERQSPSRSL